VIKILGDLVPRHGRQQVAASFTTAQFLVTSTPIVTTPIKKPRRVLIIEYDVSQLTRAEIDALLTSALRGKHDVSFRIVTKDDAEA